jgi:hypothetical protein
MFGSLDDWKSVTDILASAVTAWAIAVGGFWAYWRFLRERTRWPRAELELVLAHRTLTADLTLLHATVKIHNSGLGLMKLSGIRVYVYQVLPLDEETTEKLAHGTLIPKTGEADWSCVEKQTRQWPASKQPEVEPNERDEYGHDFLLAGSVETIFVYAYVENVAKKRGSHELGWQVTSFYDLATPSGERRVSNVAIGGAEMSEEHGPLNEQQPPRNEPNREKTEKQREPRPEPPKRPVPPPRRQPSPRPSQQPPREEPPKRPDK